MIEAKDTVMNDKGINRALGIHPPLILKTSVLKDNYYAIAKAQAEITWDKAFKAGYDKRESELVYNPDYLDFDKGVETGKELGIREVVGWIKEHKLFNNRRTDAWCEWQAQKKVWFNEKV